MNEPPKDYAPPIIEHDPGEFRRPLLVAMWSGRITLVLMLAISYALVTYYRDIPLDFLDFVFIVLWLALMAWLIVPGIPSVDRDGHEGARQGIAFRLGKKLNRVLHYRLRNTAR